MRTARFAWFLLATLALLAGCVLQKCIPLGMRPHFARFLLSRSASPIPLQVRGTRMAQRAIRFSDTTDKSIREVVEKRGFSSPTTFIRHAVEQELSGHREELVGAEERLGAGNEQGREGVVPPGGAEE